MFFCHATEALTPFIGLLILSFSSSHHKSSLCLTVICLAGVQWWKYISQQLCFITIFFFFLEICYLHLKAQILKNVWNANICSLATKWLAFWLARGEFSASKSLPPCSSHTSFFCWAWLSCRYNANTTGLNFIDIVATLKCSNLISSETEGFQP